MGPIIISARDDEADRSGLPARPGVGGRCGGQSCRLSILRGLGPAAFKGSPHRRGGTRSIVGTAHALPRQVTLRCAVTACMFGATQML